MNPIDVIKWPWKRVEELWKSCARRQRRHIKLDAMTRGLDIYGVGGSPNGNAPIAISHHDPEAITSTLRRLDKWPEAPFSQGIPKTYYASADVGERAPTDKDNWDVPEQEVNALAMWMPGAFQVVKGDRTD